MILFVISSVRKVHHHAVLTSVLEISRLEISRNTGIRRSSVGRIMHDLFIVADSEENSVPVQLGLDQIFIACQFENN